MTNVTADPKRVLEWFDRYLKSPEPMRAAFIERELSADPALRAEVEALVRADAAATRADFLMRAAASPTDRSGETIDGWLLLRWIGAGGAGAVYEARRADDASAESVALKLLSINIGSLRARFIRERQILAGLTHPYIAALIDGGVDKNGAPYMVLEYVHGAPITQHVAAHNLALEARLKLFLKVLGAVQDAHVHLVVHRDLKPSNIFVDEKGHPKLLDFGIAKMLDDEDAGLTRQGGYAMTPEYASPEQVRGEVITTATDIYALGVLLYELVTGKKPYALEDMRPGTLERVICQTDPPRPSTVIAAGTTLHRARDLDAIILRAMAKSPKLRYASCTALREDIERWLSDRPVLARKTPWLDRASLFVQRHKLGLAVSAATIAALTVGATAFVWQTQETSRARARADRVNKFLLETLSAASPSELGKDATVSQVMARAMKNTNESLAPDPRTSTEIWMTLASTYASLADFTNAKVSAESAVKFSQLSKDNELIGRSELALGGVLINLRELTKAQLLLESARKHAMTHADQQLRANTANQLGLLHSALGKEAEALKWYETALADGPKDDIGDQAVGYANIGIKQCKMGNCAAGILAQQKAVALLRRAHLKPHPNLALGLSNLGGMLVADNRVTEALPVFEEGLSMQVTLLGDAHPDAVYSRATLAKAFAKSQRIDDALRVASEAQTLADTLPNDEVTRADVAQIYAEILCDTSQFLKAQTVAESAIKLLKIQKEPDPVAIALMENILGLALAGNGNKSAGVALATEAAQMLSKQLGEKHLATQAAQKRLTRIRALP